MSDIENNNEPVQLATIVVTAEAIEEDGVNLANDFDAWLRKISDGYITLDRLETVASVVPVVGNVIAAASTVSVMVDFIERDFEVENLDWVLLCISILGIVPAMGSAIAPFRVTIGKVSKAVQKQKKVLAKSSLSKNEVDLPEIIFNLIENDLWFFAAGNLEGFVNEAKVKLPTWLDEVAKKGDELISGLIQGIDDIANKPASDFVKNINADMEKDIAGWYEPKKPVRNFFKYLGSYYKNFSVNTFKSTWQIALPEDIKQILREQLPKLNKLKTELINKVKFMGDAKNAESIAWYVEVFAAGLAGRKSKRKGGHVPANQTGQAHNQHGQNPSEVVPGQKKTHEDTTPNSCLNCPAPVDTGSSINFALGYESIEHLDARLNNILGINVSRKYASNLVQLDESEFGSRWVLPWTIQIVQHHKNKNKWQFIDENARSINLPDMKIGQKYHLEIENFSIKMIDENTIVIIRRDETVYYFEKDLKRFRLSAIQYPKGFSLGIRYDHKIKNKAGYDKTLISDIVLKQGDKELFHIACELSKNGLINKLWLIKDNQLFKKLAEYQYDINGNLTEAINEYGASHRYKYSNHLITYYSDLTGRGMNLAWDGTSYLSRAFREWADDGSFEVTLTWSNRFRSTTVKDITGAETVHNYDIDGYTTSIEYASGLEEWFYRDHAKRITKHFEPNGAVTCFEYDESGNLVKKIQPDGSIIVIAYDEKNQPVAISDANGGRWFREYDQKGNIIKEIDPLKREIKYNYNESGLPISITDAKNGVKTLQYDSAGNLVEFTDCSGKSSKWVYDNDGRLVCSENALGHKTEYFYSVENHEDSSLLRNANGQLETIKSPDGTVVKYIHDAEGRVLVFEDSNNQVTQYKYNEAGLIVEKIDANNHKLKYEWDLLGRLKNLFNENGAKYEFFYDKVGRLVKEIDFDGKNTEYNYRYSTGELVSTVEKVVSGKDRVQLFEFDINGRLEQRKIGFGSIEHELEQQLIEEFAYDSHGRLILAKNAESQLKFFYDPVGNLNIEHHEDFIAKTTAVWKHGYDEINDRIKTIRPDGQNIDWLTYGSAHAQSLIVNGQDIVSFERDDLHRESIRHYANGISQEQHYDVMGRLVQQQVIRDHEFGYQSSIKQQNNALKDSQKLVQRLYKYDRTGQLTDIKDTRRGSISYKYDPVGRLLEANGKLGKETFDFDPANNIIDQYNKNKNQRDSQTVEEKRYGYNRLVNNVVQEYLDQQYQYDAYGQLTRQKSSQGDLILEWDASGRLVHSHNAQYTTVYRYDALGRRIQKLSKHHYTGAEHNIIYGWDGDTLAYESTEQVTKHYIYEKDSFVPMLQAVYQSPIELHQTPDWSNKPYSVHRDPLWKITKQSKGFDDVWFYHCDHLGTPQEMTDHTGAIIWKAEYKAWGECKAEKAKSNFFEDSEIISNNIRFQGQYFDQETGLHYNRYRYYSPYVGRFISKDPIGLLGGDNVYAYAPNPVNWIDPLGLNKRLGSGAHNVKDAADIALASGKNQGAAAQLTVNGKVYTGVSGNIGTMHPKVQEALDSVPVNKREKWHGYCGEISCANQALEDSTNNGSISGGHCCAVNIGNSGKGHGTPKKTCRSCQGALDHLGVKYDY